MRTIKDYRRIRNLESWYDFDIRAFLAGKTLKVENVRSAKVEGVKCMKIDVRITADHEVRDYKGGTLPDNKGKVFTIRVDEIPGDERAFELQRDELKDAAGYTLGLDVEAVTGTYIYQGSSLIVSATEVEPHNLEPSQKMQVIDVTRGDRFLASMPQYRSLKVDALLDEVTLFGAVKRTGTEVRLHAFLKGGQLFDIKVPVENADALPGALLHISGPFRELVSNYSYSYDVTLNNMTALLLTLSHITFKKGVLDEGKVTIGEKIQEQDSMKEGSADYKDLYKEGL